MAVCDAILHCHVALASGSVTHVAPNNVSARNDEFPEFRVGGLYRDTAAGKTYMYVRFDNGSAIAAVAGNLAYVISSALWDPSAGTAEVGSDVSGCVGAGTTGRALVAGIFTYAVTDRYYTFVQVGGKRSDILSSGSVAAGTGLIAGTTDGQAEVYAATEANIPFATALADDV